MMFWIFCLRQYLFLLFFAEFELSMFHNNIVKISEKLKKLKICLQVTYPTDFCVLCIYVPYGKKWKYLIKKKKTTTTKKKKQKKKKKKQWLE